MEIKRCKDRMKENKEDKHDRRGKQRNEKRKKTSEKANKQDSKQTSRKANKQERKQKMVSVRDKCRFGSDVHDFIVLKHGRHTSKQDSCMDM